VFKQESKNSTQIIQTYKTKEGGLGGNLGSLQMTIAVFFFYDDALIHHIFDGFEVGY